MSKQKYLEVDIKGYKWKVFRQTDVAFKRKHGTKVYHILYPEDREIYYNSKYFTFDYVVHEVNHAFVWSTDTEHSNDLSNDDIEDLCVTVFSKNYFEIGRIAKEILNFFNGDFT